MIRLALVPKQARSRLPWAQFIFRGLSQSPLTAGSEFPRRTPNARHSPRPAPKTTSALRTSIVFGLVVALGICCATPALGRVTQGLERLLATSNDPLVRESAAQALGNRGGEHAVPLLIKHLARDGNRWVRARCAEALGRIGSPTAIRALSSSLGREKDQRVRRMVGVAMVRLGQRAGINELMWQLKAGSNHARAEVMAFLVGITGQPLGQDVKAWWRYLSTEGLMFLARRPAGSPAILEIRGLSSGAGTPRQGPFILSRRPPRTWRQIPAVVLNVPTCGGALDAGAVKAYLKRGGIVPDGSLILIQTRGGGRPAAACPGRRGGAAGGRRGVTVAAVRYLLQRAPGMLGVGIDAPTLSGAPSPGAADKSHAASRVLTSRGKVVLESLDDLDRLPATGLRLVLTPVQPGAGKGARTRVRILAVLP